MQFKYKYHLFRTENKGQSTNLGARKICNSQNKNPVCKDRKHKKPSALTGAGEMFLLRFIIIYTYTITKYFQLYSLSTGELSNNFLSCLHVLTL